MAAMDEQQAEAAKDKVSRYLKRRILEDLQSGAGIERMEVDGEFLELNIGSSVTYFDVASEFGEDVAELFWPNIKETDWRNR